jgi:hypothetical protein
VEGRELTPTLQEQINQLPDKYRIPIVLCYFQGKTNEEAARQLAWPVGTVKGRLARARELLRRRLTRRGLSAALPEMATIPMVPPALADATLKAGMSIAAGEKTAAAVSASVAALTQGALKSMLLSRLTITACMLSLLVTVVLGGALLTYRSLGSEPQAAEPLAVTLSPSADDQVVNEGKARANVPQGKDAEELEAQAREAEAKEAQALEARTKDDAKKEGQAATALDRKIEPEMLIADFRLARQALEEAHSGIYRYTPKKELDRVFEQAEKSLTGPMTMLEFYRILAPVVAAVKCGHTDVFLDRVVMNVIRTKTPLLPIRARILEGKVYVFRDFSGGSAALTGKEIRSINGVPSSKIVETMLGAARGDGDIQTSRMLQLGDWEFSIRLFTLLGLAAPYDVVVWDPKEKRETKVQLEGDTLARLQEASRAQFPKDDQNPKTLADLTFVEDGKIAVMKIHQFNQHIDDKRKKTLSDFYQESFDAMKASGTKTLIIDLRNNGGGADELGKQLLSYLLDKPFKYYDDLVINALEFRCTRDRFWQTADEMERRPDGKYRMIKHPNWGRQEISQPSFAGKVYILINGGSFSTTAEFLSHVRFHNRATFIGQESGGGYYGNTSGQGINLTLPNTKLSVRIPLVSYYLAVGGYEAPAAPRGVLPDHPISYSIEELLEEKDKELAKALELARKP